MEVFSLVPLKKNLCASPFTMPSTIALGGRDSINSAILYASAGEYAVSNRLRLRTRPLIWLTTTTLKPRPFTAFSLPSILIDAGAR